MISALKKVSDGGRVKQRKGQTKVRQRKSQRNGQTEERADG